MKEADLADLRRAVQLLEHPGLAVRLTNLVGKPIERGLEALPKKILETIQEGSTFALSKALDAALYSLRKGERSAASWDLAHKLLVGTSGALGGFLGGTTLVPELALSTTIMLRSIADIARSEGEDIRLPASRLACLEVFAFGGRSSQDDATESGYFVVRAMLAREIGRAVEYLLQKGVADATAPALVKLVSKIATRFSVQVSKKVAAQSIPVIGSVGGAMINVLFMDHFQDMARGHFIVRRLEREYGAEQIEREYRAALKNESGSEEPTL